MISRSELEVLEEWRASLLASISYFEAENKEERDLQVANDVLRNACVRFRAADVKPEAADPPDVRFRSAAFEIKEVLDEGRRRHDEYRREYARAVTATSVNDMFRDYTPVR